MSTTAAPTCSCGCATLPTISEAGGACTCGCECCSPQPDSREQEIAELRHLLQAATRRLEQLEGSDA